MLWLGIEDVKADTIAEKGDCKVKLVLIIGNAAVGKMTVGQKLMKMTGLRLFHNHMSIEPIIEIFGYYDAGIGR